MSRQAKKNLAPSVAKAGMNLLKKFVYENYEAPTGDKRDTDRQQVVGEVNVTLLDASGQPAEQCKAFVRDTSRAGCGLWSRVALPVGQSVMVSGAGGATQGMVQRMGKIRHCRGATGTGFAVGVLFDSEEASVGKPRKK